MKEWDKPVKRVAPTYFETNNVSFVSQELINLYGIPSYKEINPALFTIITFPLQFGIMFGDIGHGSLHLLFALALWLPAISNLSKEIKKVRYMYLLMALFSIFCGSLYNEVFSIPLNLFGSCYTARKVSG